MKISDFFPIIIATRLQNAARHSSDQRGCMGCVECTSSLGFQIVCSGQPTFSGCFRDEYGPDQVWISTGRDHICTNLKHATMTTVYAQKPIPCKLV